MLITISTAISTLYWTLFTPVRYTVQNSRGKFQNRASARVGATVIVYKIVHNNQDVNFDFALRAVRSSLLYIIRTASLKIRRPLVLELQ